MIRTTKPLPPLTSDEAARQSRDFRAGWEAFTGRRLAEGNSMLPGIVTADEMVQISENLATMKK